VTEPPEDSTAVVIELTAVPVAGTSSRTVIELETLGTVAIDVLLPSAEGLAGPRIQQTVEEAPSAC
jgi:hypothetical protein